MSLRCVMRGSALRLRLVVLIALLASMLGTSCASLPQAYPLYDERPAYADRPELIDPAEDEQCPICPDCPELVNPTEEELKRFLREDTTNTNPRTEDYLCLHYTRDFVANAQAAGYRAGVAFLNFYNGQGHSMAVVEVDGELVFIDVEKDSFITGEEALYLAFAAQGRQIRHLVVIW